MTTGRPLTDAEIEEQVAAMKKTAILTGYPTPKQIRALTATMRRTRQLPATKPAPRLASEQVSEPQGFKTRTSGTANQRGRVFPVGQSNSDAELRAEEAKLRDFENSEPDVQIADLRPKSNDFCDNCGYQFHQLEGGVMDTETGDRLCKWCAKTARGAVEGDRINEDVGKYSAIEQDGDSGCLGCGSRKRNKCGHGYCWADRLKFHCGCRESNEQPTWKLPVKGEDY